MWAKGYLVESAPCLQVFDVFLYGQSIEPLGILDGRHWLPVAFGEAV